MSLYLYNTLTKKKELFEPQKKTEVTMYNCGPTVYDYAHIGNLRAYVFTDTLRRALEYQNFKVKQVMNITDVGHLVNDNDDGEDKMTKALKREGKPLTLIAMKEVADFFTEAFKSDLRALNIQMPHEMPRASEHIEDAIEFVEQLLQKGFAYKISDGLYFDTSKFSEYGKLGNVNLEGLKEGARIEIKPEKHNSIDFSLWKFDSRIGWDSPWGKGFPGWHIECSAMSRRYLGQPFDIHTGGIDHIPVHHNNEIAQSEAAFGVPLARVWMHNEHLILPQGKMAKSKGNTITLKTLKERGVHPLSFRYFLLQTHYRSPLTFSWEALLGSQTALERIILNMIAFHHKNDESAPSKQMDATFEQEIEKVSGNDLDTPVLVALLNKAINVSTCRIDTIVSFDSLLGLNLFELMKEIQEKVPQEIKMRSKERDLLRANKEWEKADALRSEIEKQGFYVQDFDNSETKIIAPLSSLL